MSRPRALDLFCGAGGAAMGLHRAGFDVVGIDIKPQPRYPFPFIQGDALRPPVRLEDFDLVWASPPCQAYSRMRAHKASREYPRLIPEVRARLKVAGRLYVIENVPGSPLESAFVLCGSAFGLRSHGDRYLQRHRRFEANFFVLTHPCRHEGTAIGVYGNGGSGPGFTRSIVANAPESRVLMEMPWATQRGMSQAIPPAYSEHIGNYALMALGRVGETTPREERG